jgi:hypothetical protein
MASPAERDKTSTDTAMADNSRQHSQQSFHSETAPDTTLQSQLQRKQLGLTR